MEEIQKKKQDIREEIARRSGALSESEKNEKARDLESRVFDFANYLESKIVLLYIDAEYEVGSREILKRSLDYMKIVVLPAFDTDKRRMKILKIDRLEDLKMGPRGRLEPDPSHCKTVPIDCIDVALIPGVAFDEKGGRLGSGAGYYDRFIPLLPITTRKVALAFEWQLFPQIPMESHDRHVDIIITEKRVIYKI
jgi:5-formyltetrahydrofolate cyclo-ligase